MNKLEKAIKTELEVEILACVHGFVMIFLYSMEGFIAGYDGIDFWKVLQMGIVAYAVSWIQRRLFRKERLYSKRERLIREGCWSVLPGIITLLAGSLCRWFQGMPLWVALVFYGIVIAYYIAMWLFLQWFYKEDTRDLNEMLHHFKGERE